MKNKILVTGASGFVGSAIVAGLVNIPNSELYLTFRNSSKILNDIAANHSNVHLIADCDLTNKSHVNSLPHDFTHVIHTMACPTFDGASKKELYDANVLATELLVDHLQTTSKSLQRIVYTSTIGVHDRPIFGSSKALLKETSPLSAASYYGVTKMEAENRLADSGLNFVNARLGWVYGPKMRADSHLRVFAMMCHKRSIASKFEFPGKVMVAFIDDISNAIIELTFKAKLSHNTYLIASCEPISIGEIFSTVKEIIGDQSPFWVKRPLLKIFSLCTRILPMKIRTIMEENYLSADLSRLSQEGIRLNTHFKQGMRQSIKEGNWFE